MIAAREIDPSTIDVIVWVVLLCCVLGCIGSGAEAAEAHNGVGVLWWALILFLALAAWGGYSYALAVAG